MSPSELRKEQLKSTHAAIKAMSDPVWVTGLENLPQETPEQKKEKKAREKDAGKAFIELNRQRLKLENAQLRSIAESLRENETEIVRGRLEMEQAARQLEAVATFLDAAGRIIATGTRILKAII